MANRDSSSLYEVIYGGVPVAFQRLENGSIERLRPITSVTRQFNNDNVILFGKLNKFNIFMRPMSIANQGLDGPMFFKNVSVNQSFAIPSLVHPESETEKLAPLMEDDLSIVDSMS